MKTYFLSMFVAASSLSCISNAVDACTDFRLTAKDGTILITRSMEFAQDLQSNLRSSPRGRQFTTTTMDNKPGLSWKAKYGYLYVDGFKIDASFDGMNEAGLTFEYLYLPGETHYQTVPDGKQNKSIPYTRFGDWILSNFKNIQEVKNALDTIYVSDTLIPDMGTVILPAHASVYDASGKGIVLEFYKEKIHVSESIGVMTNSPKYEWHVTNLRNYINLSPNNPEPIMSNGISFSAFGQGSGAVGIPGDASPPSRFVKTAFMLKNVNPVNNADELVNLGEHIINNVDLPSGLVREVGAGKTSSDITQWVVFKDITHKVLYYRTYNDMTLRSVTMDKIDLSEKGQPLKMPLSTLPKITNVTADFLKTAQAKPVIKK